MQQTTTFVAVPNELLVEGKVSPVEVPTVRGLAEAYVDNTTELGIANSRLRRIKEWNEMQQKIHENSKMESLNNK